MELLFRGVVFFQVKGIDMTDLVRMTIVRNCEPDGSGGQVADQAGIPLPDGLLDEILQSFIHRYGPPPDGVSQERWMIYQVRMFVTSLLVETGVAVGVPQYIATVEERVRNINEGLTIIEG